MVVVSGDKYLVAWDAYGLTYTNISEEETMLKLNMKVLPLNVDVVI